jgi:HEAT repeat protein
MMLKTRYFISCAILSAALAMVGASTRAADENVSPAEKEQKLIAVLKSQATPGEKGLACKRLAVYGTEAAVPALAPLLADPDLASWARIALEVIPGPAADEALRQAMGDLSGRLLVGTINSIGVRRDAQAVRGLASRLRSSDKDVAAAAAVALGRIGGDRAASALEQALGRTQGEVSSSLAEGCIRCAESLLSEGRRAQAIRLYNTVRYGKVPKQKALEATRGVILARQLAGLPTLMEQLHSPDKAFFNIGLTTARELPGDEVTRALAAEVFQSAPERQPFLLLALADRGESEAMPTALQAAKKGSAKLKLAAVSVLERFGGPKVLAPLLECAASDDAETARAAVSALTRLPGDDVNADLLSRFSSAEGKTREVLIELAGQRTIQGALPAILRCAEEQNAGIRSAAVRAIGAIGEEKQVEDLARLLGKTQEAKDRSDIEAALLALGSRKGAGCVEHLLVLAQSGDGSSRIIALHALASAGGPNALAAIKTAVEDKDEAVQDEAVRTLSTWPNTWPEDSGVVEPLIAVARSASKTSHQVLALRGCLQFLQGDKKLQNGEKTAKVKELLPLLKRPEEKRLAIAVIHNIPNTEALELLAGFAADSALAEDACSALVKLAAKDNGLQKEQRQKALQTVITTSSDDATKKKAEEALKTLER